MVDEAREEARRRIVARLSQDDFLQRHLGIVCHAGDVADAVLDLFPVAFWIPGVLDPNPEPSRYLALRANVEPTPVPA